jgi:hypothetical protein
MQTRRAQIDPNDGSHELRAFVMLPASSIPVQLVPVRFCIFNSQKLDFLEQLGSAINCVPTNGRSRAAKRLPLSATMRLEAIVEISPALSGRYFDRRRPGADGLETAPLKPKADAE